MNGEIWMWKRLARAWKRHGFWRLPGLVLRNIRYFAAHAVSRQDGNAASEFDRVHGTETAGIREIGSLDIDSDNARHAVRYQPSTADFVTALIDSLGIEPAGYSFVDFGSGKGRILLLASEYPFVRVIGVEFSRELHLIASSNIAIYRSATQRCKDVVSICSDATRLGIPSGPLVCYFFNPFGASVLQQVVSNLERSLRDDPRDIVIIYVDPVHGQLFERSGCWKIVASGAHHAIYRAPAGRSVA
jgi:SAM-dependent methyltransferase